MAHANGKAQHVLVVDDDCATLALYAELLADEGYRVTPLSSPDLEPAAIAAVRPDVVLLDLHFGDGPRGIALLEQLTSDPATRALPVLVCSADTRLLKVLHERLRSWDCRVLAKPFDLDALLAAIAACLAAAPRLLPPREHAAASEA